MNSNEIILEAIDESIAVKKIIREEMVGGIEKISEAIVASYKNGGKLVLFGNGGSASDAQHVAAEFVGRFELDRQALPAIALTTDTSILTAVGNDYGFETVFSKQVEAVVKEGDVVIGISTSGNSPNVLNGILEARKKGAVTIGMTGEKGEKLAGAVDFAFLAPTGNTARIQEAHITVLHIICNIVEKTLFG
jgi:D-sedoheptulose 7-phosphate isomerase